MTFLTTALLNQRENTVPYGTTNAATVIGNGSFDGQIYLQIGAVTQGYRRNLWLWDAALDAWQCVPLSEIYGTGNPNGAITPDALMQKFFASDTSNLWIATGLTNNDWSLTN